ncbi:hypothetical protein BJF83_23640 [Nocardiopsis sp. CNR-923]|nr:tetratricopeptide repeat protein [Nocardiopsis sp. CNR-923]OLT24895.1 hypothetical protein BJF83_23640 [Nocardiopsis sp. CNR-923]
MTDPTPRDHVDFSGGAFHGPTTGKHEEHHHYPGRVAPSALFAVPAPPDGFTGRAEQLQEVLDRLTPTPTGTGAVGDRPPRGSGAVVVSALAGMGGIGKTALALQAAAVAAERGWFCAHLFVDLHSYTPHTSPIDATTALDGLLRQAGVDPDDIPTGLEGRAAFYRAALHTLTQADERNRPVLVVADNAHTHAQVEPLLPGAGGHRLLVTSRERLTVHGHQPLTLDTLALGEAVALIRARLGPTDPRSGDGDGLAALAGRCGYLPLALKIAAALLARTPTLKPGILADRLAEVSRFDDGRDDLAAVFDSSLTHLPSKHVRAFALLGANPGPDISTPAAAALTDLEPEAVEAVLEDLAAAHLLTAHPQRRWGMHDLLADHARTHPTPGDAPSDGQTDPRNRALARLLDFYTVTAADADAHLRALAGDTPPETFPGREEALAWLQAEHDNLITAVQAAHTHGHTHAAVSLPTHLALYLHRQKRFSDAITVHTQARDTHQRMNNTRGEARSWNSIGVALRQVGEFNEASTPTTVLAPSTTKRATPRGKHERGTTSAWSCRTCGAWRKQSTLTPTHALPTNKRATPTDKHERGSISAWSCRTCGAWRKQSTLTPAPAPSLTKQATPRAKRGRGTTWAWPCAGWVGSTRPSTPTNGPAPSTSRRERSTAWRWRGTISAWP